MTRCVGVICRALRGGKTPAPCGSALKGGILFSKRIPPFEPPEKDEGPSPSTPHIGKLGLEELHALRNVSAVYMASP